MTHFFQPHCDLTSENLVFVEPSNGAVFPLACRLGGVEFRVLDLTSVRFRVLDLMSASTT